MSDINCSRYPVRKLILEGNKVIEIFLWKAPTNGVPPILPSKPTELAPLNK